MYHFFSQMPIFFEAIRTTPHSRRNLLRRALGIILISIIPIWLFNLCNQIPKRTVNIDMATYGPAKTKIDLTACLGYDTKLYDYFDSTYRSPLKNSGATGVSFTMTTDSIASSIQNYSIFEKNIKEIRSVYPDNLDVDSLNALVVIKYHIDRSDKNSAMPVFGNRYKGHTVKKEGDGYVISDIPKNTSKRLVSEFSAAFKDPLIGSGWAHGTTEHKSHSLLFNNAFWALSDISQAYVGVHLSGRQYAPDRKDWGYDKFDMESNPISLTIDFGAPITTSEMIPSPDRYELARITFDDPKKIEKIIHNGLIFHVRFPHNDNLQSVKLFCLTTIIAAIFTWLMSTLWKWYQLKKDMYRQLKRTRNRT